MKLKARKSLSIYIVLLLLTASFLTYFSQKANAGLAPNASNQLSDSRPSQGSVTYTTTFTTSGTTSIQCVVILFGDTTAHIITATNPSTTAPAGMTTTSASKVTLTGGGLTNGTWSLYGSAPNGVLQYENAGGQATFTATPIVATTSGITNPSVSSFYVQVATYSTLTSHTCSGLVDTTNMMANVTTNGVSTTVTVDPTLSFSVTGTSGAVNGGPTSNAITTGSSIPFGSVSAGGAATSAAQLLTTSTNAAGGYYLYVRDTQLLTDANSDTIAANTGTPTFPTAFIGSPSVTSFAFTTSSGTIVMGSNQWAGLTTTNQAIDHQTSPQNATLVNVEYQLELKNTQPPGTYSNIITYTATPTY